MNKSLTVGIIGAGRIGKLHAENIINNIKGMEVKTIVDTLLDENIITWAHELGIKIVEDDPNMIFQDKEIDAVLICAPTDTHVNYIISAAESKKHIFCEKPVSIDQKEIQKALDAAEDKGVKLQIGFVRRFDHNHMAVAKAVKDGKIGKIEIVKITSRDPEPPRLEYIKKSGGLFFDMMIHDFDMVRFLTGSEVSEVYANGCAIINEKIAEAGDVDTAIVTMKFENGAIGVIDNSRRAAYGYDQRTEIHGSLGCVKIDNDVANLAVISSEKGSWMENPLWFFLERYNNAFVKELEEFRDAVCNEGSISVTGHDALRNVLVATAATKSLKEKRPIMIKEVEYIDENG